MSSSVAYQIQHNEEEEADLGQAPSVTHQLYDEMTARGQHFPTTVGVTEIIMGFMITILGAMEVFIVPMYESTDGYNLIEFKKQNCYGVGMMAGFILVLTGSTALRASISKRNTTVYRFYNLTILCIIVYTALSVILIIGYSEGWTAQDAYKSDTLRQVHNFVAVLNFMSLLFVLTTFFQYSRLICCGEFPLWAVWLKCFCGYCFRQVNRRYFKVKLPPADICCPCDDYDSDVTTTPRSHASSRYDGQIEFVQSMDFMRWDQYYPVSPERDMTVSPERTVSSGDYDGSTEADGKSSSGGRMSSHSEGRQDYNGRRGNYYKNSRRDISPTTPPVMGAGRATNGKGLQCNGRSV